MLRSDGEGEDELEDDDVSCPESDSRSTDSERGGVELDSARMAGTGAGPSAWALSAEVQVQSSLVELCRSRRAFHRLQASCWRATPSTRVPAVQQRLSSHSELSADWSTVRWLSTCSQSIDWSTARWLSARSQSAEWSTEEPRLTASVQTTVLHRAVLSDVYFVGRSLTIVEELRTIFFANQFP